MIKPKISNSSPDMGKENELLRVQQKKTSSLINSNPNSPPSYVEGQNDGQSSNSTLKKSRATWKRKVKDEVSKITNGDKDETLDGQNNRNVILEDDEDEVVIKFDMEQEKLKIHKHKFVSKSKKLNLDLQTVQSL